MDTKLIEHSKALVAEAKFIGIADKSTSDNYLKLALSWQSYLAIKEIFRAQKKALISEYDELVKNSRLSELKEINPAHFNKMYRAKFMKNPLK